MQALAQQCDGKNSVRGKNHGMEQGYKLKALNLMFLFESFVCSNQYIVINF